ncbi:MAG: prepilin peptidase [Minisyncoccia bacterium]
MGSTVILISYIFLVGAVFGSFLNVVLYRMRSGRSIMGRSSCGSCGKTLAPIDLIPILSYVFLNGRCRRCASKISMQYPLVEALTGSLFVLSFVGATTYYEFALYILLSCTGVLIAVYDLRHTIIPVTFNYIFAILAFCMYLPRLIEGSVTPVIVLAGGVVHFCIFWFAWKVSKGRMLGYGDVLLIFGIGTLLGILPTFFAVWVACIVGSLYGITLIILSKLHEHVRGTKVTLTSQIPFGPFLLLGTVVVLVLQEPIAAFLLSLSN